MRITFFEISPDEQLELIQMIGQNPEAHGWDCQFVPEKLEASNVSKAQDSEIISVFINSMLSAQLLGSLAKLKFITTRSTGFDHIDIKYCQGRSITVSNVPAYGSRTVAEFTFALMLGLSRKTFLAYNQIKEKHSFDFSGFEGFNLQGKTLGLIGTGRIGLNVAEIATKGFRMRVCAFDPYPNKQKAKEIGFEYMELSELLGLSDIVTIHAPYNPNTHHLINANNIRLFKPGAYLINTARGEIVDTDALIEGLESKILAGAALDVLEGERELKEDYTQAHSDHLKTLLEDHILINLSQVAITPHIAFFTKEAKREILQTTCDNIVAFAKGNPVNTTK